MNPESQDHPVPFPLLPAVPREMTRCECTGMEFERIARRMEAEGRTLESLMAETGVGRLCTACVPDLVSFATRSGRGRR